jgi:LuxR family transcriptional regulator, maltose regulon positive regulatory protein
LAQALTAPASDPGSLSPAGAPALAGRSLRGTEAAPRPGLVPRPRLVRRLIDARNVPVSLLVAPAGYGKTTLLGEWALVDERPFAWVTLDEGDNDPRALLSAIALALDGIEPVGWEVFEALASRRRDRPTAALRRLTRSLSRRKLPAVLVLDDLHVLHAEDARAVVTAVGHACGQGLQLALASRSATVFPLARLRANGDSIELRADELAMTRSEAAALLSLAKLELSAEQALSLHRRTEGWPAGLHLAALSLREQVAPRVDEFGGDDRLVTGYVREELLSSLPPAELEFVTGTSVLERLSAPVCDALLGRSDSADTLARLAHGNLMLVPLDRRERSYRYHALLGSALRAELHRREPARAAELHSRASALCAENDDPERAIGHAIDSGDVERAATLLWDSALQLLARGQQRTIWDWLDRFSDRSIADNPLLALVAAATELVAGDLYEAERWTTLARTAPGGAAAHGGIAIMQSALGRCGVGAMRAAAERAAELLGDGSPWRPLCLLLQGVAGHLAGDADDARRRLDEAAHLAAVRAPLVQAICLSQLALQAAADEDLERASVLAGRARAQVERGELGDCPSVALVYTVSAALRARSGQPAEATGDLHHGLRLLGEMTEPSPWYEVECRIIAAQATLRLNRPTAARELLAQTAQSARRVPDAPVLHAWLDRASAEIELALASSDGADWALTAAELRVLQYLPSHLSFREIAERLYVSPNTVKTHARGIYRKLGVSSRGDAVELARGAGLVEGAAAAA